jgi:hypothetical protein
MYAETIWEELYLQCVFACFLLHLLFHQYVGPRCIRGLAKMFRWCLVRPGKAFSGGFVAFTCLGYVELPTHGEDKMEKVKSTLVFEVQSQNIFWDRERYESRRIGGVVVYISDQRA